MSGITFDQFRAFVAIVETGSFAAAARQLNRTQSAVTYTIQKLEEQTGVVLFDRSTYRPALTTGGQSLLPQARQILQNVAEYQRHAAGMARGVEPAIRLAVSQFAPLAPLLAVLHTFQEHFPTVRVGVTTLTMQSTEWLDADLADLAVVPEFIPLGEDYSRRACGSVQMVAVATPDHPLGHHPGPLTADLLRRYPQIVTAARARPLPRNYAVQALNFWQADDLPAKREMILAGLGWGGMPDHLVEADLTQGRLIALTPTEWDGLDHLPVIPIVIGHRRDRPPGPAGQWLMDALPTRMRTDDGSAPLSPS
ncbi:LysR family transcriptional regulator [Novispirillum itersonii]|uniref:DNA-binding transcriptional LysR family regulator n=1 Tax=Novispirillum itersonii TaxID=189 RepID=A0A7W9ZHN7_NOVIT|nr:LysR family transcriptional regulator [Novispirillum itersonii]MBB6211658.1 DNA-binding transcriptional LysR family regulator [Novispirillum itersonii]